MPSSRECGREDLIGALRGCRVVSYVTLLDRLRARGVEPRGMVPLLDGLQRDGLILQTDRKGKRWMGYGEDRGPRYVHVRGEAMTASAPDPR